MQAKNRAEVQIVFDDGAYVRWTARKQIGRQELIRELRKFLAQFGDRDLIEERDDA